MKWSRLAVVVAITAFLLATAQCGSTRPLPLGGDGTTQTPTYTGPCAVDGETRACHAIVSQHSGFVDCFNGSQSCANGSWTSCDGNGGTVSTHALPAGGALTLSSLSSADAGGAPCVSDPCNPYCVGFNEVPPGTIKPAGGCAGGLPAPLSYANTYTMGACPAGTKGQWNNFGYTATIPAGTDIKFSVQTGPAVAGPWTPVAAVQIANAPSDHPSTCTVLGPSPCANTCGAPGTAACPASCACAVDLVAPLSTPAPLTVLNAQQPVLNVTALLESTVACGGSQGLITSPNGLNPASDGCRDDISSPCNGDPYNDCQQDFHCAANACVWNGLTAYSDPTCKDGAGNPAPDLTIGAPCDLGAGDTSTPVCNRGTGPVPNGSKIEIFNAYNGGSGTWDCVADGSPAPGATANCDYTLVAPLAPGTCVSVPGCSMSTGQRDMYVNARKLITECGAGFGGTGGGCRNNSTHVKTTGCGIAVCGAPPAPPVVPSLSSWQVTYSCVPNE